jgi:hypothetical protein
MFWVIVLVTFSAPNVVHDRQVFGADDGKPYVFTTIEQCDGEAQRQTAELSNGAPDRRFIIGCIPAKIDNTDGVHVVPTAKRGGA